MHIEIPCCKCGGAGKVQLEVAFPKLWEMLNEVKRTPGFTAPDYLDRFTGITATAINQRLEDLRHLGLVRRERRGRAWKYFPEETAYRKALR